MKWLIVGLAVSFSSVALAANQCEADCNEVATQCAETCGKALKKEAPDKIGFCKDKCKEFANECKKDCKPDGKK
jgi:hypothetical protein